MFSNDSFKNNSALFTKMNTREVIYMQSPKQSSTTTSDDDNDKFECDRVWVRARAFALVFAIT